MEKAEFEQLMRAERHGRCDGDGPKDCHPIIEIEQGGEKSHGESR